MSEERIDVDTKKDEKNPIAIILIVMIGLLISVLTGVLVYKFTSGYFEGMSIIKHKSFSKRNVEIILPDGSKVWLNSQSEIKFPKAFSPGKREVFFEGEAFFAVVKNDEKPFIINSLNSRIEVLGTTFNLRANVEEPELILTIVSGEVILFDKENDKNAIQLQKGDQGVFNHKTRNVARLSNNDVNYLSWQTGKFFFKNTPLAEVAKKLISYYQVQIVFENEALGNCKINLSVDNESLDKVLKRIKQNKQIDYELANGKIIIRGKGC